jgi:LacI family transcriptional regulator, galactose operon repressor
MSKGPTPTIRDVAEKAGVSAGTVSAVVNQRPNVRESTRGRVLAAIEELGYRPSRPARQLRISGSGGIEVLTIGLLIKEIRNPFYADIVEGASKAAAQQGAEVFTASSEGSLDREREIIRHFLASGVDALIVAPVLNPDTDLGHLYELKREGIPLVLLEQIPWLKADVVSLDNRQMAKKATQHLIQSGHQRIVHFAGPAYTAHTQDRVEGFREAFSESQLSFSQELIVPVGATLKEGYEAGLRFFGSQGRKPRPTGVSCFNDLLAVGVLRALSELGIQVPDEVAVVGFDGDPMVEYLSVPLTTVAGKNQDMGRLAVERIMTLATTDGPHESERITVPAELVTRKSSLRDLHS